MFKRCDLDVTDDLDTYLVKIGRNDLAEQLYAKEVETWATSDGESIDIDNNLLTQQMLSDFEYYLADKWPSPYEGY